LADLVCTYTGPSEGAIDLDGTVIAFTGLVPITSPEPAHSIVFNLPASAGQAVLEDDEAPGNGLSRLRSLEGTFITTTFAAPLGSLTINAAGETIVSLAMMDEGLDTETRVLAGQETDTFRLADPAAFLQNPAVTVDGSATLELNDMDATIGSLSGSGNIALGSGTLTTGGNGTSTEFAGAIHGTGGLVKEGAGVFSLAGQNTYSGPTHVVEGILQVDGQILQDQSHTSCAGSVAGYRNAWAQTFTVSESGLLTEAAVALFRASNTVPDHILFFDIRPTVGGIPVADDSQALAFGVGNTADLLDEAPTAPPYYRFDVSDFGIYVEAGDVLAIVVDFWSSPWSPSFGHSAFGWTFQPGEDAYAGGTAFERPNLSDGSEWSEVTPLGDGVPIDFNFQTFVKSGNAIPDVSPVTVGSGATLDLNDLRETVGPLAGDGEVFVGHGLLEIDQTINSIYSGAISGDGGLSKHGAGTLTLTGVAGTTTIMDGTLVVDGVIGGAGADTVTVADTATLAGSGTINASVVVEPGGTIAPGSGTASLATGDLTLSAGSTYLVQVNGPAAGTDYDQLDVAGTADLGGATLSLTLDITPEPDDRFVIVKNDGTDAVAGTLNGLAEGALLTVGPVNFNITYAGGDGNDVELIPSYVVFTVNSTDDTPDAEPGDGFARDFAGNTSLRAAIEEANARQGTDLITFGIGGGGAQTIQILAELPGITDSLIIDATTQPGYVDRPLVELTGSLAGTSDGLRVLAEADGSVVRGFVINGFAEVGKAGIRIHQADDVRIEGNFIGTDISGTNAMGNRYGVYLDDCSGTTIGGASDAARNVISGNQDGVVIHGGGHNTLQGNSVGTDVSGTTALANQDTGVYLYYSLNNTIGGTAEGPGNTIAFNGARAIHVDSGADYTTIRGNAIFSNGDLGIDLSPLDATPNDAGDADTGVNNLQNYPVVDAAFTDGSSAVVHGTLDSTPNMSFSIDLYANSVADASGYGEGEVYLGSETVVTDAAGKASFRVSLGLPIAAGQFITATATSPDGNTSEFSEAVEARSALIIDLSAGSQNVSVSSDGTTLTVVKAANTYLAPLNSIQGLVLQGATDVEQFDIDITQLLPEDLPDGIWITAGEGTEVAPGGDSMVITGSRVVTRADYHTEGSESGTITLDGLEIHFFQFEPLVDHLTVYKRSFTIGTTEDHVIRMGPAEDPRYAGMVAIDSGGDGSFEPMLFTPPRTSLDLVGNEGNETFVIKPVPGSWTAKLGVEGRGGHDNINASAWNHPLKADGGKGDDHILGGSRNDTILGGPGDDFINGGPGADDTDGGDGSNTVISDFEDALVLTEGDTFYLQAIYPGLVVGDVVEISWGDGSVDRETVNLSTATILGQHIYLDEAPLDGYAVEVLVNSVVVATGTVTVNNAAPTADAGPDVTIGEGTQVTIDGSFDDPGINDTHTFLWQVSATNGQVVADGHDKDFAFTAIDDGIYTLTYTVTDDDYGVSTDTVVVSVKNLSPTIILTGDQNINEGDALNASGSFTDPGADTWRAKVDYGDGVPPENLPLDPGKTFDLQHTYADDGQYTVTVIVEDEDGGLSSARFEVKVSNLAPSVQAGAHQVAVVDSTVHLGLATFVDAGTLDSHTATVDWGDGSAIEDGTVTESPFGPPGDPAGMNGIVSGSHVYSAVGEYTVTLAVRDDDDGVGTNTVTVTVFDATPTAAFSWTPEYQSEGVPVEFTDNSTSDPDTIVRWEWDFAGLGTSTVPDPTFTFMDNGMYEVTLIVIDSDGAPDTTSRTVPILDLDPTAAFTWEADPHEGSPIQFEDQSTSYPDAIVSWEWDFAGLGSSTDQNPIFTFVQQGTYVVTLTVTDDDGSRHAVSQSVTVLDLSPTATFAWGEAARIEGYPVWFEATATSYPDAIVSWEWDFAGLGTSAERNPSFKFMDHGNYTVTLSVTDDDGSIVTVSHDLTILDLKPMVEFTWEPDPQEGSAAEFTDWSTSYPDTIVSWSWDFGGLGTSTEQNPTFTFMDDGEHLVTLSVEDDDGSTATVSHRVTVLDVGPMAEFSWAPGEQDEGSPVQFTDKSTRHPDDIVSWSWDFAGLDSSAEQNPQFTFVDDGDYLVTLTVEDDDGSAATVSHTVRINNVDPEITTFETNSRFCGGAAENEEVTATLVLDDPGTLDTHTVVINWGDELSDTIELTNVPTTGALTLNPTHTYTTGGIYEVSVSVTDDDAGSATATTIVVVTGAGVNDGQLQIMGTPDRDTISVNFVGGNHDDDDGGDRRPRQIRVHATFLPRVRGGEDDDDDDDDGGARFRDFDAAGITNILIVLCQGDDRATIAGNVDIDSIIVGGSGRDHITGGGGNDIIQGGAGDDTLLGGRGDDILIGDDGLDRLIGNSGNDLLSGNIFDADPLDDTDPTLDLLNDIDALEDIRGAWTSGERDLAKSLFEPDLFDDDDRDLLTGSSGWDLLLLMRQDRASGGGDDDDD
jgi:autotransporter-associated beta strand protein